jgi:hypothetical protein
MSMGQQQLNDGHEDVRAVRLTVAGLAMIEPESLNGTFNAVAGHEPIAHARKPRA